MIFEKCPELLNSVDTLLLCLCRCRKLVGLVVCSGPFIWVVLLHLLWSKLSASLISSSVVGFGITLGQSHTG